MPKPPKLEKVSTIVRKYQLPYSTKTLKRLLRKAGVPFYPLNAEAKRETWLVPEKAVQDFLAQQTARAA